MVFWVVNTLSFRLLSKWPKNGSLNYNSILQLDLFCKWDEMPYVLSFMLLYQNKPVQRKYKVMSQHERRPLLDPNEKKDDLLLIQSNRVPSPPKRVLCSFLATSSSLGPPSTCPGLWGWRNRNGLTLICLVFGVPTQGTSFLCGLVINLGLMNVLGSWCIDGICLLGSKC